VSLTKYLTIGSTVAGKQSARLLQRYRGKIPYSILTFDGVFLMSLASCGMYDRSYIA
jgi:hypothetical protein